MGSCYCTKGPLILNPLEIEVFETADKKDEVDKKEEIIKIDLDNSTANNNLNKQLGHKKPSMKKVRFSLEGIKKKKRMKIKILLKKKKLKEELNKKYFNQ